MNENYKIYVHIFPNGKLYIGQTRQSLKNRFGKNGYNYKGCKRMSDAICEFGWNNIIHLLLFDNLTSEIADIIEIELIKKYKTYDINYGYNMTLGGDGGSPHETNARALLTLDDVINIRTLYNNLIPSKEVYPQYQGRISLRGF